MSDQPTPQGLEHLWTGHDHWKDKACADLERQLAEAQVERDNFRSRLRLEQASFRDCDRFLVATACERDEAQGKLDAIQKQIDHWERWASPEQHLAWLVGIGRILSEEGNE